MKWLFIYIRTVINSASFYPVTTLWLGAMIALAGTVANLISLEHALIAITMLAILLILIANLRDTHRLIRALEGSGIAVPTKPNTKETTDD